MNELIVRFLQAQNFPIRLGTAAAFLLAAEPIRQTSPAAAAWTTPCILFASMLIAWGAESAQFFVAQGFALAILAWLQTLPEFAVEAVLAWHQERKLLLANLTGALRLLIGLAWPTIYATAAISHRRLTRTPLRQITLDAHHSVEVIGLTLPLLYAGFICIKGNLSIYDAIVLTTIYAAYLYLLTKLPAQEREEIDELERVPRAIVTARPLWRNLAILGCFATGGALIYFTAEPFLGSLIAVATVVGIPTFIVVQWLAPVVSEFPELASTVYFARQENKAAMALMNIVSSNINQWTLLVSMLPIVLSLSVGAATAIQFDAEQQAELLLTIAQSTVALILLMNMRLEWWEALVLLVLYVAQVAFANTEAKSEAFAALATHMRSWITFAYFAWAAIALVLTLVRHKGLPAAGYFRQTWKEHF